MRTSTHLQAYWLALSKLCILPRIYLKNLCSWFLLKLASFIQTEVYLATSNNLDRELPIRWCIFLWKYLLLVAFTGGTWNNAYTFSPPPPPPSLHPHHCCILLTCLDCIQSNCHNISNIACSCDISLTCYVFADTQIHFSILQSINRLTFCTISALLKATILDKISYFPTLHILCVNKYTWV